MKIFGFFLILLLTIEIHGFSQTTPAGKDSSFSILFNSGIGFTHANDPHVNKWLEKYGYPAEPHVPASLHFELAAMPASSRMLYSLRLSTIVSAKNFTSFNIFGGAYYGIVKKSGFLIFAGLGAGYHNDIITLNGNLPPDYQKLASQYGHQLSLHRTGLFLEPAARLYWYPLSTRTIQFGLFANLGFDMDFNSSWKLGYYGNKGKYNHFKKLKSPSDQKKASEYGLDYCAGLSIRFKLY